MTDCGRVDFGRGWVSWYDLNHLMKTPAYSGLKRFMYEVMDAITMVEIMSVIERFWSTTRFSHQYFYDMVDVVGYPESGKVYVLDIQNIFSGDIVDIDLERLRKMVVNDINRTTGLKIDIKHTVWAREPHVVK